MEKNVSRYRWRLIKNYDEDSNKGYILEVDVEYPKHLNKLHSDLPYENWKMQSACMHFIW